MVIGHYNNMVSGIPQLPVPEVCLDAGPRSPRELIRDMLFRRMRARTFFLPAVLVAITAFAQWLFIHLFGAATTYLIFALPVIASAWFAGFRGGIVANALSLVVAFTMPSTAMWRGVEEDASTVLIRLVLMGTIGVVI